MKQNIPKKSSKDYPRDYICACGKSYLSYPALFTHIKKKHNGKAPGQIQKPTRPIKNKMVLKQKDINSLKDNIKVSEHELATKKMQDFVSEDNYTVNRIYWQQFNSLFQLVMEIHFLEKVREDIWQHLDSLKKLEQFINQTQQKGSILNKFCLGNNLSQFFKTVSLNTEDFRFQQVILLFMALLQYIIQQNPCRDVIRNNSIQILIEYINPFINSFLMQFVRASGTQNLWIMQKNNINRVFMCFYNWLKWKDYTQFCITLIE